MGWHNKLEESTSVEREMVKKRGLRLHKIFGYPKYVELGVVLDGKETYDETLGEVYVKVIDELPIVDCDLRPLPKGRAVLLFTRNDIKKLLQHNVGAIEVVVSKANELLVINHHFYDNQVLE